MLNYNALVDFFKKFPEFTKNPFFVIGESYGGIYVPTLSVRIVEGAAKINFQVTLLNFLIYIHYHHNFGFRDLLLVMD